ncbi:hypothetical protein MMC16_004440 [Acarospora aff. strigata]|nr:hypothetical protein [Acarospora aff. strigata]
MPPSKDPRICWETEIFYEQPIWCTEPDVKNIKKVVEPYLRSYGFGEPTITFFAQGALNKLYTIRTVDCDFGDEQDFIFRVALPVQLYYKTESEVATCNYVRLYTSIPAPKIFAWDSSSENELGFEWMLMEKMPGKPLAKVWDSLEYMSKLHVAKRVAEWVDELSRRRFGQIGSLYHSSKRNLGGFEVGRAVNFDLYRGRCLLYDIERGPFQSARQFYQAIISARQMDVNFYADNVQKDEVSAKDAKQEELNDGEEESDSEDHEHEDGMVYDAVDILGIPKACDALLSTLPQVFPQTSPDKPSMILYHHDISSNNILVNDHGEPTGLVDWENILTIPLALANPYPPVLQSIYGESPSFLNGTPPSDSATDDDSKKIYDDMYEKKQLKEVFRKRLEELKSPWLRTFKEATVLVKEFKDNLGGIAFRHPRTLEWVEGLEGRDDLGLPADTWSR